MGRHRHHAPNVPVSDRSASHDEPGPRSWRGQELESRQNRLGAVAIPLHDCPGSRMVIQQTATRRWMGSSSWGLFLQKSDGPGTRNRGSSGVPVGRQGFDDSAILTQRVAEGSPRTQRIPRSVVSSAGLCAETMPVVNLQPNNCPLFSRTTRNRKQGPPGFLAVSFSRLTRVARFSEMRQRFGPRVDVAFARPSRRTGQDPDRQSLRICNVKPPLRGGHPDPAQPRRGHA